MWQIPIRSVKILILIQIEKLVFNEKIKKLKQLKKSCWSVYTTVKDLPDKQIAILTNNRNI